MWELPWRRLTKQRDHFRACRASAPQSAEDFAKAAAGSPADDRHHSMVVLLRRFMARICGVAEGDLRAEDACGDVARLLGPGTATEFWLEIPLEVVQEIPSFEFFRGLEREVETLSAHRLDLDIDNDLADAVAVQWQEAANFGQWCSWMAVELVARVDHAAANNRAAGRTPM